jgi:hypothetical protein
MFKNWDAEKAKKILDLEDGSQWGKTFSVSLRLLLILIAVLSVVFALGYWHALKTRPIIPVDFSKEIAEGKTIRIKMNGDYFQANQDGLAIVDEDGEVKKTLTAQDVQGLDWKPYGFQNTIVGTYLVGSDFTGVSWEAGGGIEFFRLWSWRVGVIATDKGGYASLSYPIKALVGVPLNNTSLIYARGVSYEGNSRHALGVRVRF